MERSGRIVLVLGGTRSGKSALAESLAGASGPVTYIATGTTPDDSDPDWAERVARHRARRPASWSTIEVGAGSASAGRDLPTVLAAVPGTGLVDSLGGWVAAEQLVVDAAGLVAAIEQRSETGRTTVLVGEEVGLGVHPPTRLGRAFADALGALNQAVAAVADEVLLVVAGRAVALPAGTR